MQENPMTEKSSNVRPILKLNKLVLNNWGANPHIVVRPENRNTILIGPNGSGKTTTTDAYVTVMFGTFDSRYYNMAQKDKKERTKRTALSYVRGATKHYGELRKGKKFSSSIAIEWYDEKEDRYFCAGVVLDIRPNEEKNIPRHLWFTMNGPLPDNDLKNMTEADITELVKTRNEQYRHVIPAVSNTYIQPMQYLNVLYGKIFNGINPELFKRLQVSTLTMDVDMQTDGVIREFLFPHDPGTNLEKLSETASAFSEITKVLEAKKALMDTLKDLADAISEYNTVKAEIDRKNDVQAYIATRLLEREINRQENAKVSAQTTIEQLTRKIEDFSTAEHDHQEHLTELKVMLGKSDYSGKVRERDRLKDDINRAGRDYMRILNLRTSLRAWIDNEDVHDCLSSDFDAAFKEFMRDPLTDEAISDMMQALESGAESVAEELEICNEERKKLKEKRDELAKIKDLYDHDRKNYINRDAIDKVKNVLTIRLRDRTGKSVPVEYFSRTFEITDPEWKNAIEGRLSQKAWLVVPPEYYDLAVDILSKELRIHSVHIVDTQKMMDKPADVTKGSLYECVSTDIDYIDMSLRYFLGRIIKCDTEKDLQKAGNGVTRDCMSYVGRGISRLNPEFYTKYASIGKKITAAERQRVYDELRIASGNYEDVQGKYENLRKAAHYESLKSSAPEDLLFWSAQKGEKSKMEIALAKLEADIRLLEDGDIRNIQNQIEQEELAINDAKQKINDAQQEQKELAYVVHDAETALANTRAQLDNLKHSFPEFAGDVIEEGDKWLTKNVRTTLVATMRENFAGEMASLSSELESKDRVLTSLKFSFNAKYESFGFDDTHSCDQKILEELARQTEEYNEELYPSFKAKEKEAFEAARNNIVNKLNREIESARDTCHDINRTLRSHAFGKSFYKLRLLPATGEEGEYYEMLTDDSLDLTAGDIDDAQVSLGVMEFNAKYENTLRRFMKNFIPPQRSSYGDTPEGQKTYETVRREYEKNMLKYADYRTYLKFVLEDHPVSDEDSIGGSVASSVPKDSGGEKENAKYIILLIGLHMLYKRDDGLNVSPGIVFLDEAFRKLDRKRCGAIISYANELGLQPILAAPDKDQTLVEHMDTVEIFVNEQGVPYAELLHYGRAAIREIFGLQ